MKTAHDAYGLRQVPLLEMPGDQAAIQEMLVHPHPRRPPPGGLRGGGGGEGGETGQQGRQQTQESSSSEHDGYATPTLPT